MEVTLYLIEEGAALENRECRSFLLSFLSLSQLLPHEAPSLSRGPAAVMLGGRRASLCVLKAERLESLKLVFSEISPRGAADLLTAFSTSLASLSPSESSLSRGHLVMHFLPSPSSAASSPRLPLSSHRRAAAPSPPPAASSSSPPADLIAHLQASPSIKPLSLALVSLLSRAAMLPRPPRSLRFLFLIDADIPSVTNPSPAGLLHHSFVPLHSRQRVHYALYNVSHPADFLPFLAQFLAAAPNPPPKSAFEGFLSPETADPWAPPSGPGEGSNPIPLLIKSSSSITISTTLSSPPASSSASSPSNPSPHSDLHPKRSLTLGETPPEDAPIVRPAIRPHEASVPLLFCKDHLLFRPSRDLKTLRTYSELFSRIDAHKKAPCDALATWLDRQVSPATLSSVLCFRDLSATGLLKSLMEKLACCPFSVIKMVAAAAANKKVFSSFLLGIERSPNALLFAAQGIGGIARRDGFDVALFMLDNGADPLALARSGKSLLWYAAEFDPRSKDTHLPQGDMVQYFKRFLQAAPSLINVPDILGKYPLQNAIDYQNADLVCLMIDKGCNYLLPCTDGHSLLHYALAKPRDPHNQTIILNMMFRHSSKHADAMLCYDWATRLHPAGCPCHAWRLFFAETFIEPLAWITAPPDSPFQLRYLLNSIRQPTDEGLSRLLPALPSSPQFLYQRDQRGLHILHYVLRASSLRLLKSAFPEEVRRLSNVVSLQRQSPLLVACKEGYLDVAMLLLEYGVLPDTSDFTGASPLAVACQLSITDSNQQPRSSQWLKLHRQLIDRLIALSPACVNQRSFREVVDVSPEDPPRFRPYQLPISQISSENCWILEKLSLAGINLELQDPDHQTVLHHVIGAWNFTLAKLIGARCPWLIMQEHPTTGLKSLYSSLPELIINRHPAHRSYSILLSSWDAILDDALRTIYEQTLMLPQLHPDLSDAEVDRLIRGVAEQYAYLCDLRVRRSLSFPRNLPGSVTVSNLLQSFLPRSESVHPSHHQHFLGCFFQLAHTSLLRGYDRDHALANGCLLAMMRELSECDYRMFGFAKHKLADPDVQAKLDGISVILTHFLQSAEPLEQIECLAAWFRDVDLLIVAMVPEGDPDLRIFLRAYSLARHRIPNLWSRYHLLIDQFTPSSDPVDLELQDYHQQILDQLEMVIGSIKCFIDHEAEHLTSIENAIFVAMGTSPPSAFCLLGEVIRGLRSKHIRPAATVSIPCSPGDAAHLTWLAERYAIQIVEVTDESTSQCSARVSTTENDSYLVITPSLCAQLLIRLSDPGLMK